MSEFGTLSYNLYNIYHFCFQKLLINGKIENNTLICNEIQTKNSLKQSSELFDGIDKKRSCHLFDQTIKELKLDRFNESIFENIFITIDFNLFMQNCKKDTFEKKLYEIKNGIKLVINGKETHFVDFLKSNSMSKKMCVLYLASSYYDVIAPRITFGLDKGEYYLSKWYAYSGLSLSDGTIIDTIKLKEGELVVIPDNEKESSTYCITAISIDYLYGLISKYKKAIEGIFGIHKSEEYTITDYEKYALKNNSISKKKIIKANINILKKLNKELDAYHNSVDYVLLSELIKDDSRKDLENSLNIIKFLNYIFSVLEKESLFLIREEIAKVKDDQDMRKYLDNFHHIYWEKFSVTDYPVSINKFDGVGLISKEFANEIATNLNKIYQENKGTKKEYFYGNTFQIRLPFIKGIVNSCDFKQFFKEHNIRYIWGKTYSKDKNLPFKKYDIENVKMILTESQFKCASIIGNIQTLNDETPFDAYMRLLKEYDYNFLVTNLEPKTTNRVNLCYQFFSTLPLTDNAKEYIIESNREDFLYETEIDKILDKIVNSSPQNKKIYQLDADFYTNTKNFKNDRNKIIDRMKKRYTKLKYDITGYRKFLSGDLLELLYHAAGHHGNSLAMTKDKFLSINSVYIPNSSFYDNRWCLLLRNPHYSRNEIGLMVNSREEGTEREKYFGHLTGVLMFNPLSMLADRLGGADYDGDQIVVTSPKGLYKTMKRLYNPQTKKLIYPLVKIPSLTSSKSDYSYEKKVKSFRNTFDSRVGLISNLALQETFRVYNESVNYLQNSTEHDRIAMYTIVNGLEIDSAKQGVKPLLIYPKENHVAEVFLEAKDQAKNTGVISKKTFEKVMELENEHWLFKLIVESKNMKATKLSNKRLSYNIDYDKLDFNDIKKMIFIKGCYDCVCQYSSLRNFEKKNEDIKDSNIAALYNKITSILNSKGVFDVNEFIESIHEKIDNYYDLILKYCYGSDLTFHYLAKDNYELKKSFITETLGISGLSNDEMYLLCDFKNDGYMLLYLILHYLYYQYECYDIFTIIQKFISPKKVEDDRILNTFEDMKKISKLEYTKLDVNQVKYEIKSFLEETFELSSKNGIDINTQRGLSQIKKNIFEELKERASKLLFEHYLCFASVGDSTIVLDILYDNVVKFLESKGEENGKE